MRTDKKKPRYLSNFIALGWLAVVFSTGETLMISVLHGAARLVNSSQLFFLSKFGITSSLPSSFKLYVDLRTLPGIIRYWLQLNCIYLCAGIFLSLILFGIRWCIIKLVKKEPGTGHIILSLFAFFFMNMLLRADVIGYKLILVLFPVLTVILFGFVKLPHLQFKVLERVRLIQCLFIVFLLLFSFLFTIWQNIQLGSLKMTGNRIDSFSNVILISIDALRSDHLGCYGYEKETSPHIDALRNDGVLFSNTISTSTWTLPAHISMLTALAPEVHQVVDDGMRLSDKVMVCAEIFKEAGFTTAGFVSAPYLRSEFGYDQGFDLYDDYTIYYTSKQETHRDITSPKIHNRVSKWLEQNYNSSFFLFLHYWDVHYDYNPPPPYDTLFDPDYDGDINTDNFETNDAVNASISRRDLDHIIALYDGEIAFTDSYIGKLIKLLKQLDIYDKTLIVLTADHGAEFFEHGEKGHRKNLYDVTLKVPLIIKFPFNEEKGKRIDSQVQIIDIVPTLFSSLFQDLKLEVQGQSLLPLIKDEAPELDPYRYADLHGKLKSVRSGPVKYILNMVDVKELELYDLIKDRGEKNNIAEAKSALEKEMRGVLMEWLDSTKTMVEKVDKVDFKYSEDLKKQLKSLGYIK
ncbi:sulfatase [bacterium]